MKKRDESATAAVEFAPVLPVLVAFLFGIVAFGVIFGQDLAVENSARQASRFGVMEGRTWADLMREMTTASTRSAPTTPVTSPSCRETAAAPVAARAPAPAPPRGDSIRGVVTYRPSPTSEGES